MKAILLAGLGFGDEGKGTMTEYLAVRNKAKLVVRYNGGCQTAHNVVTNDGKHHTFSQFGSATLAGVPTFLSRFMLVEPLALFNEAVSLGAKHGITDPLNLVTVDPQALITTPWHAAANILKELARGAEGHGTCGQGIGETMQDSLERDDAVRAADIKAGGRRLIEALTKTKLRMMDKLKDTPLGAPSPRREYALWLLARKPVDMADRFAPLANRVFDDGTYLYERMLDWKDETILFEGAQGVLLDQDFGFQPHTTWTSTTFENAHTILRENDFKGEKKQVGVVRAYMTRHGAGPMPTYSVTDKAPVEKHNDSQGFQGSFLAGPIDLVLLRYAKAVVGGLDELAVTHLDLVDTDDATNRICYGYTVREKDYPFFRIDNKTTGYSANIKVNRAPTFEGMMELTAALRRVTPKYIPLRDPHGKVDVADDLCELLSNDLAPVKYQSFGPTIGDKRG
jgi:adenylosuccinate synthase